MFDKNQLVTIFGGSGFIGRHVVQKLAKEGYRIRVACRRPYLANYLYPLANIGQIQITQANIRVPTSVKESVAGAHHVINLVGVLLETGKQKFETLHNTGAQIIAESAYAAGAQMTHISALGASPHSDAHYARTKAQGEKAILSLLPDATIIRPSIVFGPEDQFFNTFATMACLSPALPLVGGGLTKLQPVFVGDLAKVIVQSVNDSTLSGKIYEIAGSEILSFRECMQLMLKIIDRKRFLVSIPWRVAQFLACIFSLLPKPPLTLDQIALLRHDVVVSQNAIEEKRTLEGLNHIPETLDSILPTYLWRYRKTGQFSSHIPPTLHL